MRGIGLVGTATALVLMVVTTPAVAVFSFFDIITGTEVITGPPYPTACHRTDVAHETAGVFECDGQVALGVRRAWDGSGAPLGTDLVALGGDAPSGGFSSSTCFEGRYRTVPGVTDPSEGSIELLVELTGFGGQPGKLVTLHPEIPMGDAGRFFDVNFDDGRTEIVCRVRFSRGVEHELELLGELPDGMSLAGVSVAIREHNAGGSRRVGPQEETSFFTANPDGFFDVRFHLDGDSAFVDQSALLSLTFTGRFLGGTSPVEAATWGAIKTLYSN